jgi:hypothetical protein
VLVVVLTAEAKAHQEDETPAGPPTDVQGRHDFRVKRTATFPHLRFWVLLSSEGRRASKALGASLFAPAGQVPFVDFAAASSSRSR